MDAGIIGIDVSKDRLDVAVRPDGEAFAVSRTGGGIDELIERLKSRAIKLVAIEATGGFETVVAAGLAGGPFANYVCDGTQIGFVDARGNAVLLGLRHFKNVCRECFGKVASVLMTDEFRRA